MTFLKRSLQLGEFPDGRVKCDPEEINIWLTEKFQRKEGAESGWLRGPSRGLRKEFATFSFVQERIL